MPDERRSRRFDELRKVLVQHDDGAWYGGWCEGWVPWPDGWRASVEYVVAPGEKYVRVVPKERVERVDG